jgi:transcriptional regulator with XRE-family HTH domain
MISGVRYVVSMTRRSLPTEWEKQMSVRLKALRKAAGLSQEQLARAADVTLRGYQKWEYGHREFTFQTGVKLAKALGVTLDVLAGIEPAKKAGK